MTSSKYKWHSCSKEDFPFKRQKVPRACQLCRQKKMRCDGRMPCARCKQHDNVCRYDEQPTRRAGGPARKAIKAEPVSNGDADVHTTYRRTNLQRISFANAMYELMRKKRRTNTTTRSYLFATPLPPLMLDFFNLTSQPFKIWAAFAERFREWQRLRTAEASDSVAREALDLFSKHNLLYGTLFDFGALLHSLTTSSGFLMQVQAAPDTPEPMILCAIFALVFHAAFRSLASTHQGMAAALEDAAAECFQHAQQRFLRVSFPASPWPDTVADHATLLHLTRASILLTHYACTAVNEETAYMTLRVGVAYAARFSSSAMAASRPHEMDAAECRRVKMLHRVLAAWQAWLSFYLHRDDWTADDGPPLQTDDDDDDDEDTRSNRGGGNAGRQRWAIHATRAYTDFLRRVSRSDMTLEEVKQQLGRLASWSLQKSSEQQQHPTTSPASILALYHHTLSIQLYFCQIPQSLQFFMHNSHQQDEDAAAASPPSDHVLDLCDTAAAEIVHVVDHLTVDCHTPVPSGSRAMPAPREPIAHAVLYPICLAASMSVLCLKLRRSASTDYESTTNAAAGRDGAGDGAGGKIRTLQRLLNPICSQMEVANVITSPLDEIHRQPPRSRSSRSSGGTATADTVAINKPTVSGNSAMEIATAAAAANPGLIQQQQQQQQQQPQRMVVRARQPWSADPDHSASAVTTSATLLEEQTLFGEAMSSRGSMQLSRRNDIDREQLDKLSHKRDLHSSTTTMTPSSSFDLFYAPTTPQPATSSMYLAAHKQPIIQQQQHMTALSHYHQPNAARRQQQQALQHDMQQQFHGKRTRGSCSYDPMMPVGGGTAAAAAAISPATAHMPRRFSYGNNVAEYPEPMAFPMYSEDYLQFFSEMGEQQQQQQQPPTPTPEPVLTAAAMAAPASTPNPSSSNSSPAMFSAMTTTTTTTMPTLPRLRRGRGKRTKHWARGRKETEAFNESMMETLHTSASTEVVMMDPLLTSAPSETHPHPPGGGASADDDNMLCVINPTHFATAAATATSSWPPPPPPTSPPPMDPSKRYSTQPPHHHHHQARAAHSNGTNMLRSQQQHHPHHQNPTWIAMPHAPSNKIDPTPTDHGMLDAFE